MSILAWSFPRGRGIAKQFIKAQTQRRSASNFAGRLDRLETTLWKHGTTGSLLLLLAFSFPIYRTCKDVYWTLAMRRLNLSEIIADRYDWLQRSMLQDEVEALCMAQLEDNKP